MLSLPSKITAWWHAWGLSHWIWPVLLWAEVKIGKHSWGSSQTIGLDEDPNYIPYKGFLIGVAMALMDHKKDGSVAVSTLFTDQLHSSSHQLVQHVWAEHTEAKFESSCNCFHKETSNVYPEKKYANEAKTDQRCCALSRNFILFSF